MLTIHKQYSSCLLHWVKPHVVQLKFKGQNPILKSWKLTNSWNHQAVDVSIDLCIYVSMYLLHLHAHTKPCTLSLVLSISRPGLIPPHSLLWACRVPVPGNLLGRQSGQGAQGMLFEGGSWAIPGTSVAPFANFHQQFAPFGLLLAPVLSKPHWSVVLHGCLFPPLLICHHHSRSVEIQWQQEGSGWHPG